MRAMRWAAPHGDALRGSFIERTRRGHLQNQARGSQLDSTILLYIATLAWRRGRGAQGGRDGERATAGLGRRGGEEGGGRGGRKERRETGSAF